MLSALIKLTSPSYNSDSYDRLSNLLFNPDHNESVLSHPIFSAPDTEFDIQLDATFDDNGVVTDIYIDE